jgi:predicted nucleic acid-binding protein
MLKKSMPKATSTINDLLAMLAGHRMYIDTNAFIFFLDRHAKYFPVVAPIFEACFKQKIFAITGGLAVAEVMIHPYRNGDAVLVASIKNFFSQKNFLTVTEHGNDLLDMAAMLAGQRKMKLIDAIHVTTAQKNGCTYFLTNDHGIKSSDALKVIQLEDFILN